MFEVLVMQVCTTALKDNCVEYSRSIPLKEYTCEWKKVEKYNELYFKGYKFVVADCTPVSVAVAKN